VRSLAPGSHLLYWIAEESVMKSLYSVWLLLHLVGLALGMGAATAKLVLLSRCKSDTDFVSVYLQVHRTITRLIIAGMILLTVSGIGWLVTARYTYGAILITKLALVVALWVVGPVIDNVLEPKFKRLAPAVGEPPSVEFTAALDRLLLVEALATGLFYVVTLLGVALP
jgi:hypothetical protein